jgi:hypothetical protein
MSLKPIDNRRAADAKKAAENATSIPPLEPVFPFTPYPGFDPVFFDVLRDPPVVPPKPTNPFDTEGD